MGAVLRAAARLLIAAVTISLLAVAVCAKADADAGQHYFIDFRARSGAPIGHTFIVYGTLDQHGRIIESHYAGFTPDRGWKPLIAMSHAVVTVSWEDRNVRPSAVYRRRLSASEYAKVVFAVHHLRSTEHRWHVLFFNCNEFAGAIAEAIELRRPPGFMPPEFYVANLRALNKP
jgi:hypothetical protein